MRDLLRQIESQVDRLQNADNLHPRTRDLLEAAVYTVLSKARYDLGVVLPAPPKEK